MYDLCELPDYVYSSNVSFFHAANSVRVVIIGVVAGCITVILTLIVILSMLCFWKTQLHKMAKLGKVYV